MPGAGIGGGPGNRRFVLRSAKVRFRAVGDSMLWVEFLSAAAPRAWRMTRQSDTPTTRPMHTSYIAANHYCQNSDGRQPKASEKRPRQKACPQKRGDAACVPDSHIHDDIMPSDKRSPSKRPVHFCEDEAKSLECEVRFPPLSELRSRPIADPVVVCSGYGMKADR